MGELLLCCKVERLVLEYFCDTPHVVQVAVVSLWLPSKVA